jgi:hypothetical protein
VSPGPPQLQHERAAAQQHACAGARQVRQRRTSEQASPSPAPLSASCLVEFASTATASRLFWIPALHSCLRLPPPRL